MTGSEQEEVPSGQPAAPAPGEAGPGSASALPPALEPSAPTQRRPVPPPLVPENIPRDLRKLRQWVAWKISEPKPGARKFGKLPINPHTGRFASTTDPTTWGTFAEALQRKRSDRVPA